MEKGARFYDEALRRVREARKTGILKGILWHQGEGNSGEPETYLEKLKGLIADLRKDLGQENLRLLRAKCFTTRKPNRSLKRSTRKLHDCLKSFRILDTLDRRD